jgi:hypothetical protein
MKSVVVLFISLSLACAAFAQTAKVTMVVFEESGFPVADAVAPSLSELHALLPGASFVGVDGLTAALSDSGTSLLVLPYGSAFPEAAWADIRAYLERGGNLLVLGGRPFTRAAYRTSTGWQLRDYNVRFVRELQIDQFQETPGSEGLKFETNPDVVTRIAPFEWEQGFSPIIRLSSSALYPRGGSAGALDARMDTLAWGVKDGRRMSAPAIQIDHVRGRFVGGRWIFVNSELTPSFYGSAAKRVVPVLAEAAARGSEEFVARPTLPLYAQGEMVQVELSWIAAAKSQKPLTAQINVTPDGQSKPEFAQSVEMVGNPVVSFAAPATKGLHVIDAKLMDGKRTVAAYHSAFWMRDQAYLRSGPKLSVNKDYLELDGRPLAVVGTTYMASDVQRLFFDHPNVYVWDRDLGQISNAGLNMIRTGWWTGWDKFCDETGRPYDRTLRTLEAYLMTARKHGLPVQFNFFAFLPDVLGGMNAYLDPEAVRRQETLIGGVTERFRDVPFVAWDLVNEPSDSQYVWKMRANGDPIELAAWNQWLRQKYPDRAALAHAWNLPTTAENETLPLPTEFEFSPRAMYAGVNSLKLYDFFEFEQHVFANWAKQMRQTIRATGAEQPITVGQDEGGYEDRLSPAFFGGEVDFTANHSWWQNDDLLWDSLVAKQPGKAMLIQETGLQRELNMDEVARRTTESEGALFERKMALSFVQGSGAIQWLWNTNDYMIEGNEAPIGALRGDATEKPEATVLRGFAQFAKNARDSLKNPVQPQVAIITSQAAQFSAVIAMQMEAQRKAVKAIAYANETPAYVIAENQIAKLGTPKLAILPSPQALDETTWQALLKYVQDGGNLLVTGPVARDTHWHVVDRMKALNISAGVEPLTYRTAAITAGDQRIPMSFNREAQNWLEAIRFAGGNGFSEQSYGKGRIFWAAYPVELAEGTVPAAKLYSYVLKKSGVEPMFESEHELSPGVLIYPTVLQDSVMYVMVSDDAADTELNIKDKLTGTRLKLTLKSQHAAMAIISKRDGSIIAKYGF